MEDSKIFLTLSEGREYTLHEIQSYLKRLNHTNICLQQELDKYKAKEKKLRKFILSSQNTEIINGGISEIRVLDMNLKKFLEKNILDILDKE